MCPPFCLEEQSPWTVCCCALRITHEVGSLNVPYFLSKNLQYRINVHQVGCVPTLLGNDGRQNHTQVITHSTFLTGVEALIGRTLLPAT